MQTAYFPILHLHSPIVHINEHEHMLLAYNLRAMIDRLKHEHAYKQEVVQAVYSLSLIDLMDTQNRMTRTTQVSPREESIFISFVNLVKKDFLVHHELDFYASQESITKTYLSRIVKKVTVHHSLQLHWCEQNFLHFFGPQQLVAFYLHHKQV